MSKAKLETERNEEFLRVKIFFKVLHSHLPLKATSNVEGFETIIKLRFHIFHLIKHLNRFGVFSNQKKIQNYSDLQKKIH